MGGKAKRRVGAVADWAMADEPDWEAIRRDYQATMASAHEIARRHGVTAQGIANKARVFGWVRLAGREQAVIGMEDAVLDMARIIQRAIASLTRRGRTLMARAEKEKAPQAELFAQHERNVESFSAVLRLVERVAVLLERGAKAARTAEANAESLKEAYEDADDRLARALGALEAQDAAGAAGTLRFTG